MNKLKKQFIKSFIKLTVIENKPNILKVHVAKLSELDEKYKIYGRYLEDAIKLLKGIHSTHIDYEHSVIVIHYDEKSVTSQKVYYWMKLILDVTVDHLEFIEKYSAIDTGYMMKKLEEVLKQKVQLFDKLT